MTRVWTEEELDRVHPLPEGWLWSKRGLDTWCARKAGGGGWMDVWVAGRADAEPALLTECVLPIGIPKPFMPPIDVALAVILASKGLDSREVMVAEMRRLAHRAEMKAERSPSCSEQEAEWAWQQATWQEAAAMLQRGMVKP